MENKAKELSQKKKNLVNWMRNSKTIRGPIHNSDIWLVESIQNDKEEVIKKNKRRKSPRNNRYIFPDMFPARRMNNHSKGQNHEILKYHIL